MTVTLENRMPPHAFAFRWTRFVVVALVLAAIGGVLVDAAKPDRRFRAPEVTASVQVRVLRNSAPTAESLERRILNNEELQDLWDDFFAAEAGKSDVRRDAELVEWRRRIRIEVDSGPIGDLRSIRIMWSGRDDLEMGAAIVESLARRFSDEVSADRWYGSVDRLRTHVRDVESAAKDLASSRLRQASSNGFQSNVAPASSFEPVPDERMNAPLLIAPNSDGPAPAAVEKPKPKKIAFPSSPAATAARSAQDPARRLATATASLRREMDEMLLPQEAEFPVVTLDRVGFSVAHLRPFWYAGVGLLSFLFAAVVSVSRVATAPAAPAQAPAAEVKADADEVTIAPAPLESDTPSASCAESSTDFEPTEDSSAPSDPYFHSACEVEARLAAPILAVVSRRTTTTRAAHRPMRRAA